MNSNICHLCGGDLYAQPLLRLDRMPKAAQYYPDKAEFSGDKGITLEIRQCSACALVQLNAAPVEYFREVITAASFSEKTKAFRLAQMTEFTDRFGLRGGKILEVGSGRGEMLDVIAAAGARAVGLEASAASVAAGRAAGREMIEGYIGDQAALPGQPFDAFVSLNYLEHLPEPGRIIRRIHASTAPGAVGFVTVPNLEYLLRTKCFYEFVSDHLSYFTRKTLAHAFESNGFDVLDCRLINEDNDIAVTVKKRAPLDLAGQFADVETLIAQLRRVVAGYRARGETVAVWGAGHRTLALLALAELGEIAYIVDSAKFKQGKFSPVLHLPIAAPEQLKTAPVDLVIVMVPGLYPGEVLKALARLETGAQVAALRDNKIEFIEVEKGAGL
ncbi:MAG TPA: class I SAM-dependent methyltransferase [Elusimicrobiales bacterium]|nr:class I SAM-dependent methyltransferase [Elusimicrobiales bacterium]